MSARPGLKRRTCTAWVFPIGLLPQTIISPVVRTCMDVSNYGHLLI